ncbi:hypothetical protein AAWM_10469 [Aspergillus awamori]|uniref:Uncharacterized protein n=1 Tax=Aspergillus awamori TaxID=105351 RepID=A0A401L7T5_ASPAW|nr:hypothetical protein AAWM_10469 [Aspergillus awamori]GKZ54492.1 hypothetical protein AnigIFM49718_010305 [Aspergillus niger]
MSDNRCPQVQVLSKQHISRYTAKSSAIALGPNRQYQGQSRKLTMMSRSMTDREEGEESTPLTEVTEGSTLGPSADSMSSSFKLPESTTLAMSEIYPPRTYRGFDDCRKSILALYGRLKERDVNQVLSYKHVGRSVFVDLEKHRSKLGAAVRFTYFKDIETLLMKIPLAPHETAHLSIAGDTRTILTNMGVEPAERVPMGATTYTTNPPSESSKEGDSALKNKILRPNDGDWPHCVIECGLSESLPHLRMAVDWWIGNSGGDVNLVLLLNISRARKTITIEKYIPFARQGPRTRAQTAGTVHVRRCVSTIVINMKANPPSVHGPPLILEFEKIVGRPAVGQEHDVVFDYAALLTIGATVFG